MRTPDAFRRSLDEPDAHLHVTGFAEGDADTVDEMLDDTEAALVWDCRGVR